MNNSLHLPVALQRQLKVRRTSGVQHVINASLGLTIVAAVAAVIAFIVVTIPPVA